MSGIPCVRGSVKMAVKAGRPRVPLGRPGNKGNDEYGLGVKVRMNEGRRVEEKNESTTGDEGIEGD